VKKYIFSHPWLLVFASLSGAVVQGLFVLSTWLTMSLIDAMTEGDQDTFISLISVAVIVVLLYWIGISIAPRMQFAYSAKTARTLKKDVFQGVLDTKISDFKQGNSAKYISVLNNDIDNINDQYFGKIPSLAKDISSVILAIVTMAIISPLNALIATLLSALPLVVPFIFAKTLSRTQMTASASAISFNQKTKDYLMGFEVIKTFGVEKNIQPRFWRAATRLMKARYRAGAAMADVTALNMSVLMVVSFINYFVAGFFVLRGDITVGAVVAISVLGGAIQHPFTFVSSHISSIKSTKEIGKRVLDIMRQKDTNLRNINMINLENDIELKNLDFAYEAEANNGNKKHLALKNVSYTFKKGGKYAIVGHSGSGKSTLAKLLMGYYDNYEGNILINNHNIRDISREGLYNVVSVLHQNVFLLDDTLKNNITLYNNYSDEKYRNALQRAHLLDVEARLPNSSDTLLGEGGNTLSGGERQRISIARAILKGSEVMLLDEATVSLDNIIAHDIEKSIIGMDDLTCIFVTHRYSKDILEKCNGILVMKSGELFEQGTFEELYKNKGYFYSLLTAFGG